jgi:UDP-N-acetylmuramyl pentapeptide phosphotransferase/UDP-N-acetylglucosamine-1-phosphate transferase
VSRQEKAGAFDVRNVIAELIGLYGVVLVLVGLLDDSAEAMAKTGGVNANLWAGVTMLVVAAGFALWSWLRPTVVRAPKAEKSAD